MRRSDDQAACAGRILVAGIGNGVRGDDAVGPIAVRSLAGRLPDGVMTVIRGGDMLSLIEEWKPFDAVILVDAAAPAGFPGRIHRFDLNAEKIPRDLSPVSSHAFGLAETIELARALSVVPKQVIVFAIEVSAFDTGSEVTPAVRAAAGRAGDEIIAEIRRLQAAGIEPAAP